jgi:hypothetical protein
MANGESEKVENQRGKDASAKSETSDQSSVDDTDALSQAPSRVHIFKDKAPSASPSKSGDEPLKCSSLSANRLTGPQYGAGDAVIGVGVRVPKIDFVGEWIRLQCQIQIGKKALYDAAMKAEDLDAMIQGLRRTRARIFQKRK